MIAGREGGKEGARSEEEERSAYYVLYYKRKKKKRSDWRKTDPEQKWAERQASRAMEEEGEKERLLFFSHSSLAFV